MPDTGGSTAAEPGWEWDPSLYAGSAAHYAVGRVPYPPAVVSTLVTALGLDGSQRLLDVGCGPGSLTLLLAPHVAEAIGVDADADMLVVAARLAAEQGVTNATWRHLRAEDLPADLPAMDVIVFAQSLHWMDRARVLAAARGLLAAGGAAVHVHATTHQGLDPDEAMHQGGRGPGRERGGDSPTDPTSPRPPWDAITALVHRYLGPRARAGRSLLPATTGGGGRAWQVRRSPTWEPDAYRGAGFAGPQRLSVPGWPVERSAEQVLAAVHSLSWAAPHLFGDRLGDFDAELRDLLAGAGENGRFSEQMGSIDLDLWR